MSLSPISPQSKHQLQLTYQPYWLSIVKQYLSRMASIQQVFGLFKSPPFTGPSHAPPLQPFQRQPVDWSRKLCVCFYSSYSQSGGDRKSAGRDIKGCRATPLLPMGQRWVEISHRASRPWLYTAIGGRSFHLGLRSFSLCIVLEGC